MALPRYLGVLFLPLCTLAFVATGPHAPGVSLLALIVPLGMVVVDRCQLHVSFPLLRGTGLRCFALAISTVTFTYSVG